MKTGDILHDPKVSLTIQDFLISLPYSKSIVEDTRDMKKAFENMKRHLTMAKITVPVIGKAGRTTDNILYERTNNMNQAQEATS